jgi:hypothetical protein
MLRVLSDDQANRHPICLAQSIFIGQPFFGQSLTASYQIEFKESKQLKHNCLQPVFAFISIGFLRAAIFR